MKNKAYTKHRFLVSLTTSVSAWLLATLMIITTLARAQVPVVSPAAQQAHATITAYDGPATCIACHQQQAQQMFGSVHYQEIADTPNVPNINGPAGKGRNGSMVMNSYCGTPVTSSRATCANCHAGNGRIPSPELTAQQLANIDCMMCHQDAYKRVPAPPYRSVSFPGTNGTTHTIQAVIEDETGFDFIPDTAKMAISILDAARTVHLPTRASCLRCHAGAGGSDGGKRGDISTVTVNPPVSSDVHMSPQGANLSCAECHSVGGHRVSGRGVDLRPNDVTNQLSCANCHTDRPHGDYNAHTGTTRDVHAGRVACQSCHIPAFAKDKSTEMQRSWLEADFSMAACRGQGGWLPSEVRASNVTPLYRWFDGTSLASVLGQVPVETAPGQYTLALPNGSVQSPGAKLYPMKLHLSDAAQQDATGLLIPHSTWSFFTSGDFTKAVADGQALSGLSGPASVVQVQEYQTINHGVEASTNALRCGACHASEPGGPVRMSLQGELGYALKGAMNQVCTQCHENKSSRGFLWVHDYHVRGRGYDCSSCHNFSRPERGLTRITAIRPSAPTGPVATPATDTRIDLVWADNSSSEQGFKVERSTDGINFAQIGTVAANATTAADTTVSAGQSYYYRVRAYNATGDSAYSQIGRAATSSSTPQPGTPVITWANPAAIVYGTALSSRELNATADVPGTFQYTPAAGVILAAGNAQVLSVVFTPADTQAYRTVSAALTLDVAKKPLTVAANAASRLYGAANPAFTGTLAGVVNGDAITASYACAATAASPVGTYPIVAGLNDPTGRLVNYTVTRNDALLTVSPAPLSIRADNKTKVVGQPNPVLTATYTGFVNGDTAASLDAPVVLTTTATDASPAGTYPIVASGAADANYNITFLNGTLTVTPTAVTMTGLVVQPATATVQAGQTQQFTARAAYSDGTTADVTGSAVWQSSNPAVASVSASGLASGLAAGTTSITASLSGFSASAALTVDAGGSTGTKTFSNTGRVSIPSGGRASVYPATITVSGLSGAISKVTVRLASLTHGNPDDLDILLVGPAGQKVILMSDAGGSEDAEHVTLAFDDAASSALSDGGRLRTGTYRPSNYQSGDAFVSPAPAGPYASALSAFNNTNPNGTWKLFILDDQKGNSGSLSAGWSLTITTAQ